MKTIFKMMRRLDDSWQGDVLGVACLFGIAYGLFIFGCAVGL